MDRKINTQLVFSKVVLALIVVVLTSACTHIQVNMLNNQIRSLRYSGQYDQALVIAKKSLEVAENSFYKNHTDVSASMTELAFVYQALGQYTLAEPLFKRALAILEEFEGLDHVSALNTASGLNNLAIMYMFMGQYAQAEPLYKRSLVIRERILEPNDILVVLSLNNLAQLYYMQGQYEQAETFFKRLLSISWMRLFSALVIVMGAAIGWHPWVISI